MYKKAIIFLDFNGTIDDVEDGKGAILFHGLTKIDRVFNGNIQIAIITSALAHKGLSIKEDLICTLLHFPKYLQKKFTYLIEENCKYLSRIENLKYKETTLMTNSTGTKKTGVELCLKNIRSDDITHCIFVGDDEKVDLNMLDANVGNRKKIMLLANRRSLVEQRHPIYKVNLKCDKLYEDMKNFVPQTSQTFIIKTTPQSYGVGKGLELVSEWIERNKD